MRWTLPSWIAIGLGAVLTLLGFVYLLFVENGTPSEYVVNRLIASAPVLILSGAFLLGAGLLSLQSAWTTWCGSGDGCGCCGDDCKCGDCGDCCGPEGGHEGHEH